LHCRHPARFFGVVERTGGSESIVTPSNETDGGTYMQVLTMFVELQILVGGFVAK
jgi:hypothetical protein